jgi:DNA excision repair protein ERCC-3
MFIRECTKRYGKAKLVLKHNKFYVESEHPAVLRELLRDPLIAEARIVDSSLKDNADGFVESTKAAEMEENLKILNVDPDKDESEDEDEDDNEMYDYLFDNKSGNGEDKAAASKKKKTPKQKGLTTVAFQIKGEAVETVKKQAIDLDYPLMEEYDFRNDKTNANIPMDLKPHTRIRRYQERSLAKMFGNGRARSGIIVLPCGAGKTLTAVTAAQTIKKSTICLCTNAVSVLQFKFQFKLWTNIPDDRIALFTSDRKDVLHPDACLLITTYTMISYSGKRSDESAKVMDAIRNREWGLMLMDEVHVVPAKMFRRVVGSVKAHCRLGLTATLVREDDLISDLNFLIGPKLYEANWMDLTAQGYLASVQCVEVWCPMTGPFMKEYLNAHKNAKLKQLLYVMNPSKLRTAQFLVNFHEDRGDKIILFSDVVFSLKKYADILQRPIIYGETSEKERQAILGTFRASE